MSSANFRLRTEGLARAFAVLHCRWALSTSTELFVHELLILFREFFYFIACIIGLWDDRAVDQEN
jgi:hypothetical protein